MLPNGEEVESILFFWHELYETEDIKYEMMMRRTMKKDPVYACHGRVVAKNDAAAIKQVTARVAEAKKQNEDIEAAFQKRLSAWKKEHAIWWE